MIAVNTCNGFNYQSVKQNLNRDERTYYLVHSFTCYKVWMRNHQEKCQFKQIDTNSFTTRAIRDRQKKREIKYFFVGFVIFCLQLSLNIQLWRDWCRLRFGRDKASIP